MVLQPLPTVQFKIPAPGGRPVTQAGMNAQQTGAKADDGPARLTGWDKKWWIDKTARILRGGDGVSPFEDMQELVSLPKETIARRFMDDPRFGDTVLDFNLYFLGYKVDRLKSDGAYVLEAYDFANAVNSAKAVLKDGDYLTLFDLEGDYYLPPLSEAPTEDEKSTEDSKLTPSALRQKAAGELSEHIESLIELVDNPTPSPLPQLCGEIEQITEQQTELTEAFFRAFTDEEIFVLNRAGLPGFLFDDLERLLDKNCAVSTEDDLETDAIENRLWTINTKLDKAFNEIFKFEPTKYGPDSVADFKPLNRSELPAANPWPAFGYRQSAALVNSSTNHNRKRSAYILKRFFCDDMTPVGFDMPKEHVLGAHGSQTSCFSCHYKLDPMAGFFRNYGVEFKDLSGDTEIVFDDAATIPLTDYLRSWRSPESPDGAWDIGYIRSARWKKVNDYGHSLSDLSRIIRKAPEAKRCLIKRLAQYMLGENQTVDGGYLDRLSAKFERDAAVNSSQALKNAMISILTSNTYQQRNPDPRICYDVTRRTAAGDRPPCRIAYILEKNCSQCHDSSMTENDLDLTVWNSGAPGEAPNFNHLDNSGNPVKARETLAEIAKRLSSSDPRKRMPKKKTMPNTERQELFLWAQDQLSSGTASQ